MDRLSQLIEAALFSADGPVSLNSLTALEGDATKSEILAALETLRSQYTEAGHGVELVEVADGYQLLTKREFAEAIARAHLVTRPHSGLRGYPPGRDLLRGHLRWRRPAWRQGDE